MLLMLAFLFPVANGGIPGDLVSSLEESLCALPTLLMLWRLGPAPRWAASGIGEAERGCM